MMTPLWSLDTVEVDGLQFRAEVFADDCLSEPWKEHDCHGPVAETRNVRDKLPGEWVLHRFDRSNGGYLYDYAEACRIARAQGWGLGEREYLLLAERLKRKPTKGEIAAEAARLDFERLQAWCRGDWHWVGVVVTLLDAHGRKTHESESLWGIESDAGDYLDDVARELAGEIAARVGDSPMLCVPIRAA